MDYDSSLPDPAQFFIELALFFKDLCFEFVQGSLVAAAVLLAADLMDQTHLLVREKKSKNKNKEKIKIGVGGGVVREKKIEF